MKAEHPASATRAVVGVACAVALSIAAGAAAQTPPREVEFTFKTDVMLDMNGYTLPAGAYRLERVPDTAGLFRLHHGEAASDGEPLAVIDAWDTRWRDKAEAKPSGSVAVLEVRDPKKGQSVRSLEGFSIRGNYYKIRDVLAVDIEALSSN
jgi:hypothetical protein